MRVRVRVMVSVRVRVGVMIDTAALTCSPLSIPFTHPLAPYDHQYYYFNYKHCNLSSFTHQHSDIMTSELALSRSQLKTKFFGFLDENKLIFVVLSGRFQRLEGDFGFGFGVLF